MAGLTAPVVGKAGKPVPLVEDMFGLPVNQPLLHEVVKAEAAARRQGTHSSKTRGMVRGGGAKPYRQKGTGRARQGTIRAPQFKGGGVVFGPTPRSHAVKVNRKAARKARAIGLSQHARAGSLAVFDASTFAAPRTKDALALIADWRKERPLVVCVSLGEADAALSFRNIPACRRGRAARARGHRPPVGAQPARLARSARAAVVLGSRGGGGVVSSITSNPGQVILAPVVSEKSYGLIAGNRFTFRVAKSAHKIQVRQAIEELFNVKVVDVKIISVPAKPKRRGANVGARGGYKKAIVVLRDGDTIELFEGAH